MERTLTIVFASTTGHTEFVVATLVDVLASAMPGLTIHRRRAESTDSKDLEQAGILILACGTWNTLSTEGQLSPFMHDLLVSRAAAANLAGIPAAAIGLGDERYFFTARAADLLALYLSAHGASILLQELRIVGEPFDQKKIIEAWGKKLAKKIAGLPSPSLA